MKWVEGITEPSVWARKGEIKSGDIVELDDADAEYLIERGQVIEVPPPHGEEPKRRRGRPKGSRNKPKVEGSDAETEDEEQD